MLPRRKNWKSKISGCKPQAGSGLCSLLIHLSKKAVNKVIDTQYTFMLSFRVFANQNLRRPLNSLHFPLSLFDFPSPPKLFKINTYKSLSKQRTLTSFRMNTYEKQGGGGVLWLTSPLLSSNFPTYLQSSFAFNRFHTFSFSVSCNSFISLPAVAGHSYESCRVISTLPLLFTPSPEGNSTPSPFRPPAPLLASPLSLPY